jgi:uncharacterized membrane protein YdbT with pleckstrin-like domain
MAETYLESLLGDNEKVLLETHQHWLVLFNKIFLELILAAILIAGSLIGSNYYPIAIYGLALVLIPIIGLIRDVMVWRNNKYVVTNRRVMRVSGVFGKDALDSSLEKVNDVKLSQSFLGRMFGYGDIQILTASELGVDMFHQINDPIHFKTTMLNAKEDLEIDETDLIELRGSSDIPSMIEKLDDLRKRGILSEEEFQRKKAELLAKM